MLPFETTIPVTFPILCPLDTQRFASVLEISPVRYVFKVIEPIVQFVTIFVVYHNAVFGWTESTSRFSFSKKSVGNKFMNQVESHLAIVGFPETDTVVPATSAKYATQYARTITMGAFWGSKILDAPQTTDFVKAIESNDRFPYFVFHLVRIFRELGGVKSHSS
jgi:hypothetical protein